MRGNSPRKQGHEGEQSRQRRTALCLWALLSLFPFSLFFCTWARSPNPSPHVIFVWVSRAELCGRDKQLPNLRGLTQQRLVSHSCYVSGVVKGETAILSTQQSSFQAYEGKANHMPTPNQMRVDKYYRTTCLGEWDYRGITLNTIMSPTP